MKKEDALSSLLFCCALEYAFRKVQETIRLDMNDTLQVLAYLDDVNLIGDIRIERNADVLLNAYEDFGLRVKTGKY